MQSRRPPTQKARDIRVPGHYQIGTNWDNIDIVVVTKEKKGLFVELMEPIDAQPIVSDHSVGVQAFPTSDKYYYKLVSELPANLMVVRHLPFKDTTGV